LKEGELSNVRHLGMDSLTQTIAFYYDILSRGHGSRLARKEGRKEEKEKRRAIPIITMHHDVVSR